MIVVRLILKCWYLLDSSIRSAVDSALVFVAVPFQLSMNSKYCCCSCIYRHVRCILNLLNEYVGGGYTYTHIDKRIVNYEFVCVFVCAGKRSERSILIFVLQ